MNPLLWSCDYPVWTTVALFSISLMGPSSPCLILAVDLKERPKDGATLSHFWQPAILSVSGFSEELGDCLSPLCRWRAQWKGHHLLSSQFVHSSAQRDLQSVELPARSLPTSWVWVSVPLPGLDSPGHQSHHAHAPLFCCCTHPNTFQPG